MSLKKILDTFYYYDLLDGCDVAVNPQNFIVRGYGRSLHDPEGSKARYDLETNPEILYKIQQRIIEDLGGIQKEKGDPNRLIPTGRVPKRECSGIIQIVDVNPYLINILKESKTSTVRQYIARELMQDILRKVQPTNIDNERIIYDHMEKYDIDDDDDWEDDDDREPWMPDDYDTEGEEWNKTEKKTNNKKKPEVDSYFNRLGQDNPQYWDPDNEEESEDWYGDWNPEDDTENE
jgi:hypothetical protein